MLMRETHCAVEEVSEFVQDCAGFGNVDPLLRVDRSADAVHAELAAEFCEVFRADHERPAVFVESVEDWLWDFAEFQQECVHVPLCQIFHCDRCFGRRNGQRLHQDGVKKLCGFGTRDEIRRRTRVVGTFPDGNSALMLVCARLRHVAGTQWGNKKYMNMKHLEAALDDASIAG